ncbi:hypothetical protein PENTCL1PPCAC_6037, partial [Pristionchus entomophagus]
VLDRFMLPQSPSLRRTMHQTLIVAVLVTVASAAPLRFKRQYESEIVAISPKGKWTSIYHQPLDSIRDKGLPLLEHHGALRDVQTYPQTGPSPYPFYLNQGYLNTLLSSSTNPLPPSYGQPRLLIVVPPGFNFPASLGAAPAAALPVAAAGTVAPFA